MLVVARPTNTDGRDRLDHPADPLPAHHGRGRQGVCQAEVRRLQRRTLELNGAKERTYML